jgi:hypothetical protein
LDRSRAKRWGELQGRDMAGTQYEKGMNTDQVTRGQSSRNLHGRYRMTPSNSLTYVSNFRDSSNCSRIQNAQPGQEILVLVHPEQEPIADPLGAKGSRSQDGTLFTVEIPWQMARISPSNGNTRCSSSSPNFSNRSERRRNGSRLGPIASGEAHRRQSFRQCWRRFIVSRSVG